ncbi:MAG: phosphodiester glycosidase family protein [Clostridia bacterium]|nr:phosphodiester glycosidase family protein [Clostridia bacterium]
MKKPKQVHFSIIIIADILLIGISLCVFALFHHVLIRYDIDSGKVNGAATGMTFPSIHGEETSASSAIVNYTEPSGSCAVMTSDTSPSDSAAQTTSPDNGDFTYGEIISDNCSYRSGNISAVLETIVENGHEYFVVDIKVRSMACFATAIAPEGKKSEYVHVMAEENNAVCAINGDYFGLVKGGTAIRNGCILSTGAKMDVCVLYLDGRMEIVPRRGFDENAELEKGAWQAWDFGPSLLDENGKAIKKFVTRSDIEGRHPRSAIGYYAPGHYCFVTIGGRKSGHADGVKLETLAEIFEKLGCAKAYNLDGGKSAIMTFGDRIVNEEYNGTGRENSDIIYIREPVIQEGKE